MFHFMFARAKIFGGMLSAVLCMSTPLSGQVATQVTPVPSGAEVFEALPHLAGVRPVHRPTHMLRYPVVVQSGAGLRPQARMAFLPAARWDSKPDGAMWTRAAMSAIRSHAPQLDDVVPRDIETWCPGYASNPDHLRQAFWVGMMSSLAFYESTLRPEAVGGGNQWFGLLQIYPPTARGYECRARTGPALTNPAANLSCAARIMNVTVARDRAVAVHDGRWRGVAADWGPMTTAAKRNAMSAWTRQQSYCQVQASVARVIRPLARPAMSAATETLSTSN